MKVIPKSTLFLFSFSIIILANGALISAQDNIVDSRHTGFEIVYDSKGAAMVLVPAGTFVMGYTFEHALELCEELMPPNAREGSICTSHYLHLYVLPPEQVEVDEFYLDLYEVSVVDYTTCIDAEVCSWDPLRNLPPAPTSVPVRAVSFYDARIYCAWRDARLPTEAEWEYAARGPDNLEFPWGNEFDGRKVNFCDVNCGTLPEFISPQWDDGYTEVAPVDAYADGRSWAGVYNLAGNVSEWTLTGVQLSGEMSAIPHRIVKGPHQTTGWTRMCLAAEEQGQQAIGFRCARSTAPSTLP
jgi:formylglycine-generating enzyme required for sulfatase activity